MTITALELSQTGPQLASRVLAAQADVVAEGGELFLTSGPRSYSVQRYLRTEYVEKRRSIEAADPDAVQGVSPWGWPVRGSYHMVQLDGWSWAVDVAWARITSARVRAIFARHGLLQTVPREDWHYQAFDGTGWFTDYTTSLVPQSLDIWEEPMLALHAPTVRPGGYNGEQVLDFTYLPSNGERQGDLVCVQSVIALRDTTPDAVEREVLVFFNAQQFRATIPAGGASVLVTVVNSGLASVVGNDLVAEARELWTRV